MPPAALDWIAGRAPYFLDHGDAMTRFLLPLSFAVALAAALSGATAGDRSMSTAAQWEAMDNCAKASFRQYPVYTAAAAAKRDTFVRQCLQSAHLPPRTDLAPQ